MEITRINTYQDPRFSQTALNQHGCFLVNGEPCEVEIISDTEAIIRGPERGEYTELIEEFRFYTPHITVFYNSNGQIIQKFPKKSVIKLSLRDIQPSQFYVDEEKVRAIQEFVHKPDDIIIQVLKYGDRYISLDGHTRLCYAVMQGWQQVRAVEEDSGDYIYGFVEEAVKRGIKTPYDLLLVSHSGYEEKWNKFCDDYFKQMGDKNLDT